jgi:tetratricopeptide (TPR) repeat protein
VDFDKAMEAGQLDRARSILDTRAADPEEHEFDLREGYGELAREFDRAGRQDDAIAAMELAIEHGWRSAPDARSDIAEFHLRAGRAEQAAAIWATLREEMPGDVWLYNAAGLSYSEAGEDELAVAWLGRGIVVAIESGDPEGLVAQLSDMRRRCLERLGLEHDELEQRVEPFLATWSDPKPPDGRSALLEAIEARQRAADADPPPGAPGSGTALAISWFPSGEYEAALERWPDLTEIWSDVPHTVYSGRMDGHIKWMRQHGVIVRAVAPIVVDDYVAWCEENEVDPENGRAAYAAERLRDGDVISWPPGRNESCWCGSGRKYKKCCGPTPAAPMHGESG